MGRSVVRVDRISLFVGSFDPGAYQLRSLRTCPRRHEALGCCRGGFPRGDNLGLQFVN
jgi:hypothetical protein